ncbi:uncharacterized protein G2W53_041144 [Senna tora]|uniref:Uncharacterized protein n=1 Tax=Senna tora TaxID=362788 RepID=A0A834SGY0_9FABA|nr:uncharacterized protein G2W53_041144 [Senna tora]
MGHRMGSWHAGVLRKAMGDSHSSTSWQFMSIEDKSPQRLWAGRSP